MSKIAYLVDFSIRTRVVVDVDDNLEEKDPWMNDGLFDDVYSKAYDNVLSDLPNYLSCENITEIDEDTECPAGTFPLD